ncbi:MULTISPECIES: glucuronate isomerase [unclassified Paenibacillus]|uniref:glucuronate isomerase n=1 Tax=unclassified Paenibacillus TaxID=185978 RepID=UPI001AE1C272|nr:MULTISPECIES: glucuronate isomerase [unclassified Paenibacillus]MBP1153344.1 glucuronate isomerase [Paenibacillus sp. PvP091]MBP1171273.1 glucuronate isomerase [Paenibacillus sp. PvR098]MBP2442301.1 glucuronate isomerase [Paenibacillus sp. PvP052]
MKKFLDENFLLNNGTAIDLYNHYAKDMPIIDYHCHLSPQEIYENKTFKNITEVWLYGDHYKWRVMRANGVDEKYITGDASDYEKFLAWARTVPMTIGNPLYQWSHLELQRFFGIYELINEKNAPLIWDKVNALLGGEGFSARDLIAKSNVKVVCTTDDPADSLEYHIKLKEENDFSVAVLPAFRPDKGLEINRSTFVPWVEKLGQVSGQPISSYDHFLAALDSRARFFHSVGGTVSDHALDYVAYAETTKEEAADIFAYAMQGRAVSLEEEKMFKTYTLIFLGKIYAELGWVTQFHINAARNNNSRMFEQLGPDTGFDSINDSAPAYPLGKLLDAMDKENALHKTILYSLNPKDNYVLASVMGAFQNGGIPGKMQLGSAWWYNDTKDGMLEQMKTLANVGLLSRFVGMLTDSRSFLSYTRHEYFRRLVCNLLGEWVENGEVPDDMELLGSIVQGISFNNAKEYFDFPIKA